MEKHASIVKEGQAELAIALLGMYESGVGVSEICRDFELSETHVRNIIRFERLRQAAARGQAGRG
jgi:uncharacterized protein (DUF433 family)